jgi:hypothetical protein
MMKKSFKKLDVVSYVNFLVKNFIILMTGLAETDLLNFDLSNEKKIIRIKTNRKTLFFTLAKRTLCIIIIFYWLLSLKSGMNMVFEQNKNNIQEYPGNLSNQKNELDQNNVGVSLYQINDSYIKSLAK